MAINVDQAAGFGASGLVVKDDDDQVLGYLAFQSGDPTGSPAPVSTFVFRTDNQLLYYKFGSGNGDWRQIRGEDLTFDNTSSSLGVNNVQAAIDVVVNRQNILAYRDFVLNDAGLVKNTQTLETYVTLNAVLPVDGLYKVEWNWQWSLNSASRDFICNLRANSTVIWDQQQEPKDAAGSGVNLPNTDGGNTNTGTNQRHIQNVSEVLNLSAGANAFDMEFASDSNNNRAAIYRGSILIEKWGLS